MKRAALLLAISAAVLSAQAARKPVVEFEMMTWPEIKHAIQDEGMINVILYNGGVEQRGPQNVSGGHNLMAGETARDIALKLGHTLVAPPIPYSVNEAPETLPWGTIGLTAPIFAEINERVAEQLVKNGFKNIFLMGDHGGGQKELGEIAKRLDEKYSGKGVHVYFCDQMYDKAQNDYWKWLEENHYPSYGHASIMDTSEMLYLSTRDGRDWGWVKQDLIKSAVGDPVLARGQRRDPSVPRINNGITGDARPSTSELGRRIFDMKVDYAVRQMKEFLASAKGN